jgi:F-box associated protein
MNFQNLPDDILFEIFSYLSNNYVYYVFRCVNSRFAKFVVKNIAIMHNKNYLRKYYGKYIKDYLSESSILIFEQKLYLSDAQHRILRFCEIEKSGFDFIDYDKDGYPILSDSDSISVLDSIYYNNYSDYHDSDHYNQNQNNSWIGTAIIIIIIGLFLVFDIS